MLDKSGQKMVGETPKWPIVAHFRHQWTFAHNHSALWDNFFIFLDSGRIPEVRNNIHSGYLSGIFFGFCNDELSIDILSNKQMCTVKLEFSSSSVQVQVLASSKVIKCFE